MDITKGYHMGFTDFYSTANILDEFYVEINRKKYLRETSFGDADVANIIMKGLEGITSQNVKAIIGVIAAIAKYSGRKIKDILYLFSADGFRAIRSFIDNDIIGSDEFKYMLRMKENPDRYKGFSGLETFITDMKEHNPKIFDSLQTAVDKIFK